MGKAWTEEELTVLRKHYLVDKSAAEIGRQLGRSPGSIIGKYNRLREEEPNLRPVATPNNAPAMRERRRQKRKRQLTPPAQAQSANIAVTVKCEPVPEAVAEAKSKWKDRADLDERECHFEFRGLYCGVRVPGVPGMTGWKPYCALHKKNLYREVERDGARKEWERHK